MRLLINSSVSVWGHASALTLSLLFLLALSVPVQAASFRVIDDFTGSPDQFIFVLPGDSSATGITYDAGTPADDLRGTPGIEVINPSNPVVPTLVIANGAAGTNATGNTSFGGFDSIIFAWDYVSQSGGALGIAEIALGNAFRTDIAEIQGQAFITVTLTDGSGNVAPVTVNVDGEPPITTAFSIFFPIADFLTFEPLLDLNDLRRIDFDVDVPETILF